VRQADKETILAYLPRPAAHAWSTPVHPAKPYSFADTTAQSPALEAGLYLAVASSDERFSPGSSLLSAVIVDVTDLFMIASTRARFRLRPRRPPPPPRPRPALLHRQRAHRRARRRAYRRISARPLAAGRARLARYRRLGPRPGRGGRLASIQRRCQRPVRSP